MTDPDPQFTVTEPPFDAHVRSPVTALRLVGLLAAATLLSFPLQQSAHWHFIHPPRSAPPRTADARGQMATVGRAGNRAGRASTPFTDSTQGRLHRT